MATHAEHLKDRAGRRLPAIYLPHGGGPWNLPGGDSMDLPGYAALRSWIGTLAAYRDAGMRAILIISAHWEEAVPTVHEGAAPGLLYDYYGFPESAYRLSWPAPGEPSVASEAAALLGAAGYEVGRELDRGYDHGTFVPLMVAFPEADVPVAQLSLVEGLDPATHFRIGRALEPLRERGVLILGSGMSYHNLRGFFSGGPAVARDSAAFDAWLGEAAAIPDPEARGEALSRWRAAPSALACHPRSEHLAPLFVAAGAGGADPGVREFGGALMGATVSGIRFG
ncbi:MAG TPA: class III extradiol ring-cleavage dioxygenase [Spirochaetales bacterium]|nr:class III extradiol ring-cleavage dioxygenase [Spirochaetales bacterium]